MGLYWRNNILYLDVVDEYGNRRQQIVFTLHAGLELIMHIYDEFVKLMPNLVTVCEKTIGSKTAT